MVFTAHEVLPPRTANQVDAWREVFAAVDRVVVHSAGSASRLAELGVEPGQDRRDPAPRLRERQRNAGRGADGTTLLFFGLIRRYKGLDVLIRALPEVVDAVPEARLVVAGDPLEPVEPLRDLAASLGVDDRIDWQLGYVPGDRIPALMASATVVVLPYRRIEASGVLADAVGNGRPAVVSDVGAIGETVRRFGAGEVVPPEDPAALAAACIRLLGDESPLGRRLRGRRGRAAALTWEAAAEAHERLYPRSPPSAAAVPRHRGLQERLDRDPGGAARPPAGLPPGEGAELLRLRRGPGDRPAASARYRARLGRLPALFADAPADAVRGEVSPEYLANPWSCGRSARAFPRRGSSPSSATRSSARTPTTSCTCGTATNGSTSPRRSPRRRSVAAPALPLATTSRPASTAGSPPVLRRVSARAAPGAPVRGLRRRPHSVLKPLFAFVGVDPALARRPSGPSTSRASRATPSSEPPCAGEARHATPARSRAPPGEGRARPRPRPAAP